MKPISAYKAIFFDAGDTLLTIPSDRTILRKFLEERDLPRDEDLVGQYLTDAIRKFYVGKELNAGQLCSPEMDRMFWMNIYAYILRQLGAEEHWSLEQINACSNELYDEYMKPEHYRLFDDVSENLQRFQSMGLGLAIVSNFAPGLREILKDKGIDGFFHPIIISTEVGLEKPNPEIFQLALERSHYKAPDVLYVGDHEWNDVWAPAQAGIDAVRIKRYDYHIGEGITTLSELV